MSRFSPGSSLGVVDKLLARDTGHFPGHTGPNSSPHKPPGMLSLTPAFSPPSFPPVTPSSLPCFRQASQVCYADAPTTVTVHTPCFSHHFAVSGGKWEGLPAWFQRVPPHLGASLQEHPCRCPRYHLTCASGCMAAG